MAARSGALLVCATPIGNLGDVTLRVLDALEEADVIEAEDTRVTRRLLSANDIHTPLEAYHARNAEARTASVVERIRGGERVALVSDAGMPGVSDPGARLVDACLDAGLAVEVLPGPSAILTALVASGLPTHAFYFGGFLPRKAGARRRALEELSGLDATLVFYESPKRTAATLDSIAEVMPRRRAAMARELTKLHEEVRRGPVAEVAAGVEGRDLRGEVVLLVGPPPRDERAEPLDEDAVRRDIRARLGAGSSVRDAVRAVAEDRGLRRSLVYEIAISLGDAGGEGA